MVINPIVGVYLPHDKDSLLQVGWVYPQYEKLIDPGTYRCWGKNASSSIAVSGSLLLVGSVIYTHSIGSVYHLYTTYIYIALWGYYMLPIPPIKGTRKLHWPHVYSDPVGKGISIYFCETMGGSSTKGSMDGFEEQLESE